MPNRADKLYKIRTTKRLKITPLIQVTLDLYEGATANSKKATITIKNLEKRKLYLKTFIKLPTTPTLELNIANLEEEQSKKLDFTLQNYPSLMGQKIKIQILDDAGDIFVNREFTLP